ncbi:antibiotic biosynthesis monooxygenase family protein [Marinactinospora rubrisoli]|uniref:Antibiotic biosynthesis monooxygenase family protein n=1 Tax=Marinactinospora rubrisoli TaxID=2715399 RepID=A0ABW2KP37_9ACTN
MSDQESSIAENAVIFVNRFTLHTSPEEFERVFAETARFLQRQPGFLEYTLSRHADNPGGYLNIARWRDARAFHTAVTHPDFAAHAAALRAVSTSDPGLYVPRRTATAQAAEQERP